MLDSYYRNGLDMFFTHAHGPVSRPDVMAFVQANAERLAMSTTIGKGLKDLMPVTVGGVLWFIVSEHHQVKAAAFFAGLKTGENLSADSPILAVRNRLVHGKGGRRKLSPRESMTVMIRGWNAFFAGKPLVRVPTHPSASLAIDGVPEVTPIPAVQALHAGVAKLVEIYQPRLKKSA